MNVQRFPATDRGIKDIGWLRSHFFFSFSDFADPTRSAFGTLLAFNDDFLEAGKGFGLHPHKNMEIVSIMLKGSMNHKDSMGYSNEVHEDWVQIMSAGTGLRHEEYNVGNSEVNFLQVWIQPKLQNIDPRYQFRNFPKASRRNKLTTIVSADEGAGHCWINQNATLSLGLYDAGSKATYAFNPANKCLFFFAISGAYEIGGTAVPARDGLGIWNTSAIDITVKEGGEFLLIETPVNQK